MTTATLTHRRADPYAVPEPTPCIVCAGEGCATCDGSGRESPWFRLPPMRSQGLRRCIYRPSCVAGMGRLSLATAKHERAKLTHAEYAIAEFDCDWKGRAFYVHKIGTERRHEVFLGADGSATCTCEGESFQSAAKANQRAWNEGGETFATLGCVHADAMSALLKAGWLDLEAKAVA